MSTLSCLMKLQGVKMDDTASEHTKAEVGKRPLEDLRDAFGSDLLALVEGHDVDVDVRQRNREFVSSNKHGKSWKILSDVPQSPISPSLHGTSDPGEPSEICQRTSPKKALMPEKACCGWKRKVKYEVEHCYYRSDVPDSGGGCRGLVVSVVYGQYM